MLTYYQAPVGYEMTVLRYIDVHQPRYAIRDLIVDAQLRKYRRDVQLANRDLRMYSPNIK